MAHELQPPLFLHHSLFTTLHIPADYRSLLASFSVNKQPALGTAVEMLTLCFDCECGGSFEVPKV